MNTSRAEALFSVAARNRRIGRSGSRCPGSRKQVILGQHLEESVQRQHAERAVLNYHRSDVNGEAAIWSLKEVEARLANADCHDHMKPASPEQAVFAEALQRDTTEPSATNAPVAKP